MPQESRLKIKGMTRLLLSILETQSSIYCNFGNKVRGGYYITISYQIKKGPSDSHARHALHVILWSMQFDCPKMANHIFHGLNFIPNLRCMHVSFSLCIACLHGRNQDLNLEGAEVLCSKILKNWNINTRGWQQYVISINFSIICIFSLIWRKINNRNL